MTSLEAQWEVLQPPNPPPLGYATDLHYFSCGFRRYLNVFYVFFVISFYRFLYVFCTFSCIAFYVFICFFVLLAVAKIISKQIICFWKNSVQPSSDLVEI